LLTENELETSVNLQLACIERDSYLKNHIKLATDGKHTTEVYRQWSQWSLLMGLTEKQLESARTTDRPATRNLGPIEEDRKKLIADRTRKEGKTQLNYEELLEMARDYYDHNAKRGHIYEFLLGENRVWK